MVTIVVNEPAQAIVMGMANASLMGFVNVKTDTQALTAPLPFVMNNAAFMVGSVIMESVNSVVQTMRVTHAKTAPCSPLVF